MASGTGSVRADRLRVECVVFDLAGTLTAPLPPMAPDVPWRRYAQALTDPRDSEAVAQRLTRAELEVHRRSVSEQRSHSFDDVLKIADVPFDDRAVDAYRSAWHPYTLAASGSSAVLRRLRAGRIRTGLLSNTIWPSDWHRAMLRRDGLLDLLDAVVFTTDIDVIKPHPRAFQHVLEQLGDPPPGSCLFVGDRLYEDILGAQRVGMRTVHVTSDVTAAEFRVESDVEPDHRINRIDGLLAVLELGVEST